MDELVEEIRNKKEIAQKKSKRHDQFFVARPEPQKQKPAKPEHFEFEQGEFPSSTLYISELDSAMALRDGRSGSVRLGAGKERVWTRYHGWIRSPPPRADRRWVR